MDLWTKHARPTWGVNQSPRSHFWNESTSNRLQTSCVTNGLRAGFRTSAISLSNQWQDITSQLWRPGIASKQWVGFSKTKTLRDKKRGEKICFGTMGWMGAKSVHLTPTSKVEKWHNACRICPHASHKITKEGPICKYFSWYNDYERSGITWYTPYYKSDILYEILNNMKY